MAEQQGFAPGHEETNWHLAEAEIVAALQSSGVAPTPEAVVVKVKQLAARKVAPKTDAAAVNATVPSETVTPRKRVSKKSE